MRGAREGVPGDEVGVFTKLLVYLGTRRRRLAGGSRVSQISLNLNCERVRATEHAPRNPCRLLEHRHGLAEIVERGTIVVAERRRVNRHHLECDVMRIAENASRHGNIFARQ